MSISKLGTLAIGVIGAAAVLGGSGGASAGDGTAQSLLADLRSSGAGLTYVRGGRHDGHMRGHRAGRHRAFGGRRFGHAGHGYHRYRGYGRGYGYRRGGYGAGGAALGGLAAGAIVGGALAAQAAQGGDAAGPSRADVASCSRRFKSYDASSGTYLGYDGQRHACP
ncbi:MULTISPECIES: BA14K family protein [unclassified Methylobacterium]|jgi:hypothetical protein|uniref:BA14K family protein n=1 Tax=unclassified Methylobacterium TaxID=2615210 RepID=UPI00068BC3F6|nr:MULTISPECIES: BA14K family protein [unclassified Methylobacterium]SFV14428.1 BA14K-like protein [Methylobacterium sp. UNCCL125]